MNFVSTQNDLPRRKRQSSARSDSPRGANADVQPRSSPCACGGGCPRCQKSPAMQMKSKVSQPGDALETEADKAAEHVLSTPSSRPSIKGVAQAGTSIARTPSSSPASASAHATTPSSGQPLDATTREFFEPRFGRDFGDVRIHNGAEAALTAQAVSARAYTVGRDVVFGDGEYAPQSSAGRRLLAHELAHVVQQDSQPAQVMRDPIPSLDPSMLSDEDLMSQMQETRNWLDKHVMMELEYGPMKDYLEALEQEYYTRQTPNAAAAAPAIVNAAGQSVSIRWPPPPEVCVAPPKIGQTMMPDDVIKYLINQRGFTSTAPRTALDAAGKTVATRPALSPFDPKVFGKPLGLGFETNAVIQIFDAQGKIIAEEAGAFLKSGPHAEMQAIERLIARLKGVDLTGGRMVVVVDQMTCSGCGGGLKVAAQNMGLETYEVWLPLRESMTEPGVPASPKTSVRSATLPGRPPVAAYQVEGVTFAPNQSNIFKPPVVLPPSPPMTPNVPGWADDMLKNGKTTVDFSNPNWANEAFPENNPIKIPGAPGSSAVPEFTFVPPKVPWYRGSTVTTIGKIGTGMALGYATNEISMGIVEGSGLKLSEQDKTAFSLGTAALHPGVNIIAAADAVFMEKIIYEPVIKAFYDDGWKRYKEMNPDATPQQYNEDTQYWDECAKGDCPDW